jgi:hypothetical protein
MSAQPIDTESYDEKSLLADEAQYCSYGDTVHYLDPP